MFSVTCHNDLFGNVLTQNFRNLAWSWLSIGLSRHIKSYQSIRFYGILSINNLLTHFLQLMYICSIHFNAKFNNWHPQRDRTNVRAITYGNFQTYKHMYLWGHESISVSIETISKLEKFDSIRFEVVLSQLTAQWTGLGKWQIKIEEIGFSCDLCTMITLIMVNITLIPYRVWPFEYRTFYDWESHPQYLELEIWVDVDDGSRV